MAGIFAALVIALLVALVFSPGYRGRDASIVPLFIFFLVLFLAGIAANYWIVPFGPVWAGIAWFPLVFLVLIVAIMMSAPSAYRHRSERNNKETTTTTSAVAISIFVWLLLVLLLIAILVGYFREPVFIDSNSRACLGC